jgi:ATP-dependent RNA helicase MRH4
MAAQFANDADGTFGVHPLGASRPVDVRVGTPNKLLEMARGRKWDRVKDETDKQLAAELSGSRHETSSKSPEPEMGLQNVEWVIVDEADILFGNSSILISMTDETNSAYSRPRLPGEHSNALG